MTGRSSTSTGAPTSAGSAWPATITARAEMVSRPPRASRYLRRTRPFSVIAGRRARSARSEFTDCSGPADPRSESGRIEPGAAAHDVAALELVLLAPGLDAPRADAEVAEARLVAGVEAGLGREALGELGRDVVRLRGLDRALDQDDVPDQADAEAHLAGR